MRPERLFDPRRLAAVAALVLAAAGAAGAQDDATIFSEGRPPIVETLGEGRFVKLTGVAEPGKIVWFNFALAREMGLRLPPGDVLTPELERALVRHLSWRLLKPGEAAGGRPTVEMYADRYGGWGMGHNRGAGRAAFFGGHNLNIKGVGVTPLVSGATHYSHRHGGAPLREGLLEALWGEVGRNLFTHGSTRILAVVDNGDHTTWEDGGRERRALIVRAGHQLRPAHLYAEGFSRAQDLETLLRMLEATGTLVRTTRGGAEVVDLRASLERVAERHATTAAELYRHRILHGGLSPGNKAFDGGMLDLGTITSQPRTAPVHVLDYTDHTGRVRADLRFDTENEWRVRDLKHFAEIAAAARGRPGFAFEAFDVGAHYERAWRAALERQLLRATGLRGEVAEAVRAAAPDLAREYTETLRKLGALTNDVDMNLERGPVARGSVVDVFGALGALGGPGARGEVTPARVLEALAIDADTPARRAEAEALARKLAGLHARVLEAAWTHGASHYEGRADFERSVGERAALENRPLTELSRSGLLAGLNELIAAYEATGDPTRLRAELDRMIETSALDLEGALRAGARVLSDGSVVTGERRVAGLTYAVRSTAGGERLVRVELPLEAVGAGAELRYRLVAHGGGELSAEGVREVDYRYTTDGWGSHREVRGVLGAGLDGRPALVFEAPVARGATGALEGVFRVGEGGWWLKDGGRNFAGYRFVAPSAGELARVEARVVHGEGFGPRAARGPLGPAPPSPLDPGELGRHFERVRAAAAARGHERLAELAEAERPAAAAAARRAGAAVVVLEGSAAVDARYDAASNTVRVTSGLLAAIDAAAGGLPAGERAAFRGRALALVLAHELAHGLGVRAERAADAEALRILGRAGVTLPPAELRRVLEVAGGGRAGLGLLDRLRALAEYGTQAGRARALEAAARGEPDRFARYRRADGTIDWRRATGDRALREGAGLLHFGLALFLKELAVVARSGDRARIEEFFDGLLETDFYTHYGLFVLGARAGEVAYVRYLERYVKPRFVNGILKTNLVLAAGLAIPQLAEGTFDGKVFAISLGSLGLSSAAVKSGVASLRWVVDLRSGAGASAAARLGVPASRLARLGGWFYTAVELAVILYLADEVTERVHAHLDERAARRALSDAGAALGRAAGDPRASAADVAAAAERLRDAWSGWREHLVRDVVAEEARFAARLEKVAERAKKLEDERTAALTRVANQPALRRSLEARHGSLEAWAAARAREDEAALAAEVEAAATAFERAREAGLRAVYEGPTRGRPLLPPVAGSTGAAGAGGAAERDWLALGARAGAAGDPWGGRTDVFAGWGRGRAAAGFADALGGASENRLESYADEAALLEALRDAARRAGRPADVVAALDGSLAVVRRAHALDERLWRGDGSLDPAGGGAGAPGAGGPTPGLVGALDAAGAAGGDDAGRGWALEPARAVGAPGPAR